MRAMPRSSLEVVGSEFFLQRLVRLLTDPARLDGAGDGVEERLECYRRRGYLGCRGYDIEIGDHVPHSKGL